MPRTKKTAKRVGNTRIRANPGECIHECRRLCEFGCESLQMRTGRKIPANLAANLAANARSFANVATNADGPANVRRRAPGHNKKKRVGPNVGRS